MPTYKKSQKENPGNYRLFTLTLVPGKATGLIILSAITRNAEDRPSQHGVIKGRSCLTKLVSFCHSMTHLEEEEKAEMLSA